MKKKILLGLLIAVAAAGMVFIGCSPSYEDNDEIYEPLTIKGKAANGDDVEIVISTKRIVPRTVLTPMNGDSYVLWLNKKETSRGTIRVSKDLITFYPAKGAIFIASYSLEGNSIVLFEVPNADGTLVTGLSPSNPGISVPSSPGGSGPDPGPGPGPGPAPNLTEVEKLENDLRDLEADVEVSADKRTVTVKGGASVPKDTTIIVPINVNMVVDGAFQVKGKVTVSNDGSLEVKELDVSADGAELVVSGSNSALTVNGAIDTAKTAGVNVTDGGKITVTGSVNVTTGALPVGKGGTLYANGGIEGKTSTGITVEKNANVITPNIDASSITVESSTGALAAARAVVEDQPGKLTVSDGEIKVSGIVKVSGIMTLNKTTMEVNSTTTISGGEGSFTLYTDSVLSVKSGTVTVGTGGTLAAESGSNLNVSGGGLTVSGGTLNANGALTVSSGRTVTVSSGTVTVGGTLTAVAGSTLDVSGTGKLTVTGGTSNVSGELKVGSGGTMTISSGTLTAESGSKLNVSGGGGLTVSGGKLEAVAGSTLNLSGGGGLTVSGGGALDVGGTLTIGNGKVTINSGALIAGSSLDLSGGGELTVSGGNLAVTNGSKLDVSGTGKLTVSGGTSNVSGEVKVGPGGTMTISNGALTAESKLDLSGGGELTVSGGKLDVREALTVGSGKVTISNSGTLTAASKLDLSSGGELTVSGGKLDVREALTVGNGTVTINGGTLTAESSLDLSGGGGLTVSGGTLDVREALTVGNGTVTISNSGTLTAASKLDLSSGGFAFNGGTLNVNGGMALDGITLNVGNGTMNISSEVTVGKNTAATLGVSGGTVNVNNNGKLEIYSNGTLTLTGNNALTISGGVVDVSEGTLDAGSYNKITINGGTLIVPSGDDETALNEAIKAVKKANRGANNNSGEVVIQLTSKFYAAVNTANTYIKVDMDTNPLTSEAVTSTQGIPYTIRGRGIDDVNSTLKVGIWLANNNITLENVWIKIDSVDAVGSVHNQDSGQVPRYKFDNAYYYVGIMIGRNKGISEGKVYTYYYANYGTVRDCKIEITGPPFTAGIWVRGGNLTIEGNIVTATSNASSSVQALAFEVWNTGIKVLNNELTAKYTIYPAGANSSSAYDGGTLNVPASALFINAFFEYASPGYQNWEVSGNKLSFGNSNNSASAHNGVQNSCFSFFINVYDVPHYNGREGVDEMRNANFSMPTTNPGSNWATSKNGTSNAKSMITQLINNNINTMTGGNGFGIFFLYLDEGDNVFEAYTLQDRNIVRISYWGYEIDTGTGKYDSPDKYGNLELNLSTDVWSDKPNTVYKRQWEPVP
jgi:hypothetical protein